MKSFSSYLTEEVKEVVFTFGRFNPPTTGHEKLISKLASTAKGGATYRVYASKSQDAKKNPLDFKTKIKFMRKMFPKHARNIMSDADVRNVFDILVKLYDQGFNKATMVVGSDRVNEFSALTDKYNGVKARHGFYNFENGIQVISAGDRDPDADGISGMSASKMRAAAAENDFISFGKGLPAGFKEAQQLFDAVRKGMGINEEPDYSNRVHFDPISETREQYVQGELFSEGDVVVVKESDEVGQVIMLGSNYVLVELAEGKRVRKWLDAIELVEKEDPDIKDREGTQPAKYHSGLAKSTKAKRDAQFKKQADMDDDNPAAYKPAPGDKSAKTKPSQYTKKFKDMYGEEVSPKQLSDLEKFADRMLKKYDIDVEFTRHFADRMNDPRNDPELKIAELQKLFKKIERNKGKQIRSNPDIEAVLKDINSSINLPVVIDYKGGEFTVTAKTVMRKKNFKTTSKILQYESSYDYNITENTEKALRNKADKTGISYGILKKVFDRGVAAWRTGHRPGTTPTQWGLARVNSFATGGKTRTTADADLWKKHKGK